MIVIRRRTLLLASAAALAVPRGFAQTGRRPRVALLSGGTEAASAPSVRAFTDGLRELGYRPDVNIDLDARYADNSPDRALSLAAAIAAQKPDVLVANGTGIRAAYGLSPPIPVVFVQSGDPVDAGHADSFARPGRHATGISLLALDLIAKRVQLLREAVPNMQRIAFLASPEHPGQKRELAASQAAARQLGLDVAYHEAINEQQLAAALPAVVAGKVQGALLFSDALMVGQRDALSAFFLRHAIPSASGWSAFPDSGHLLSYGPERGRVWRRLATFVDRILKGARPGELPIELPTVFELVVNLRTAKAMKLTVPQSLLVRADRVIE